MSQLEQRQRQHCKPARFSLPPREFKVQAQLFLVPWQQPHIQVPPHRLAEVSQG